MMVSFHLEAEDNDVVSGPHLGRSEDLVVKVVGEDDYRADLVRREKLFRGELEAEGAKVEGKTRAMSLQLVDEWAKLAKATIDYNTELSAEWRKIALDSMKPAATGA